MPLKSVLIIKQGGVTLKIKGMVPAFFLLFCILFSSVSSAATTVLITDEFTGLTPPAGAKYVNFARDTKNYQDLLNWFTPKTCPDPSALNLKKGTLTAATATYTVSGATEVEIGFHIVGSGVSSQYTWGYALGWEFLNLLTTGKDPYGNDRPVGTYMPMDLKKVTKVYIAADDNMYAKFADGKWGKYVSDPNYAFYPTTSVPDGLVNLGVYIQYTKDNTNWTYVDYDVTSVRSMDDPQDSVVPDPNHWYYETAKAVLPVGVKAVRVSAYMPSKYYGRDASQNEKIIDDSAGRSWRVALGRVIIRGTSSTQSTVSSSASTSGSSIASSSTAVSSGTGSQAQTSSMSGDSSAGSSAGSSDGTSTGVSDGASSADPEQSTDVSSVSGESGNGSTASQADDKPVSGSRLWPIIIIVAVLAVVAGAAVMLVRSRKRK